MKHKGKSELKAWREGQGLGEVKKSKTLQKEMYE